MYDTAVVSLNGDKCWGPKNKVLDGRTSVSGWNKRGKANGFGFEY